MKRSEDNERCDCGEEEWCNICITPRYKDVREVECGSCFDIVEIHPDDTHCPSCRMPLESYEEERARQMGVD